MYIPVVLPLRFLYLKEWSTEISALETKNFQSYIGGYRGYIVIWNSAPSN